MKKTFLKAFTAVIAVLALSLNVFAAGSIVGSIDMPNASSDRGKVTLSAVDLSKYSEELQRIIDRLNNARRGTTVKDAFGDDLPSPINLYGQNSIIKKGIDLGLYKFLSPVMDITFDSSQRRIAVRIDDHIWFFKRISGGCLLLQGFINVVLLLK